jgi:hypothetical protein
MVLERWDKAAKVAYDRRIFNELVSLRFVEDHRNAVILGPVGVGKTFLASGLGHLCCRAGFNVRFHRADELLRSLKQSRMDNSRDALMTQLSTVDVLIIDDFALEPMSREESRDVYQLLLWARPPTPWWPGSWATPRPKCSPCTISVPASRSGSTPPRPSGETQRNIAYWQQAR